MTSVTQCCKRTRTTPWRWTKAIHLHLIDAVEPLTHDPVISTSISPLILAQCCQHQPAQNNLRHYPPATLDLLTCPQFHNPHSPSLSNSAFPNPAHEHTNTLPARSRRICKNSIHHLVARSSPVQPRAAMRQSRFHCSFLATMNHA